jgi:hypothetical protein
MPTYDEVIEAIPAHVRKPKPRYGHRIAKALLAIAIGISIAIVVKSVFFYRPTGTSGFSKLASCDTAFVFHREVPKEFGILLSEVDQHLKQDGFERVNERTAIDSCKVHGDPSRMSSGAFHWAANHKPKFRWYRKYVDDDVPLIVVTVTHTDSANDIAHPVHLHYCEVYLIWDFRGRASRAAEVRQLGESYVQHTKANWHLSCHGTLKMSEEQQAADSELGRKLRQEYLAKYKE